MTAEQVVQLTGQVLNLPLQSTVIRCPACGVIDESEVVSDDIEEHQLLCACCKMCRFLCWCCVNLGIRGKEIDEGDDAPVDIFDHYHYCKSCKCFLGMGKKNRVK